jgi:hypothetical protein
MAATLGQSPTRRRGSSSGKPARWTPGRWGSVCGARAWTGETNGAWGRKIQPAAGGSVLRAVWDSGEGGGLAAGTPHGVGPGSDRRAASRPRPGRGARGPDCWLERE